MFYEPPHPLVALKQPAQQEIVSPGEYDPKSQVTEGFQDEGIREQLTASQVLTSTATVANSKKGVIAYDSDTSDKAMIG
jgi:hypothetical protein